MSAEQQVTCVPNPKLSAVDKKPEEENLQKERIKRKWLLPSEVFQAVSFLLSRFKSIRDKDNVVTF